MLSRCLLALPVLLLSLAPLSAGEAPAVLVADVGLATPAQRLLAVSIQGFANSRPEGPHVFLLTHPQDEEWLEYSVRLSPRPVETVTVDQLLERFRADVKGQILYDPGQPVTVNIATTAAGLRGAVISDTDLGLPTVLDLRGRWESAGQAYAWAYATLYPECSRTQAALLPPEAVYMRDLAIQQRMFVFSDASGSQETSFRQALQRLAPGAAIYGEASPSVRADLSAASHFLVSATQAANLSFLSLVDAGAPFHQYLRYTEPAAPRYLALIFDCSDLGFAVTDMPGLWERATRGLLPLGWALPAALAQAAPPVLHRYYADAYRSGVDGFLLGPSGAGDMDLAAAGAPYGFLEATARAVSALDTHTALYNASGTAADLSAVIARLAADTGLRGVFVLSPSDFAPVLLGGIPVVAAPRVTSVAAAVSYLDRIPLGRRFAALCLDPRYLTPADAAHIAANVAGRFLPVLPEQLAELMATPAQPEQPATPEALVTSADYPDPAVAALPIPIKAAVEGPGDLRSAVVLYRPLIGPLWFYEPMQLADGACRAELPPILCGGEVTLSIRTVSAAGHVAFSPAWTITVPREDADGDGLSDAEERLLLTDSHTADTDGDGLQDAGDWSPLRPDQVTVTYFGPLYPPSDLTYLVEDDGSEAGPDGRRLRPGQTCAYWLPTGRRPPGAPAVVGLDASGPAALAVSTDGVAFESQFSGPLDGAWYSAGLPAELPAGVFLRITCPEDSSEGLIVRAVGVFSTRDGPSLAGLAFYPLHPGPGQPIATSATAFSPRGIAQVSLTYRVNAGGTIAVPMRPIDSSQRFRASIPALEDQDRLEWWVTAQDSEGAETASAPAFVRIGAWGRETVSLLAARDFVGEWSRSGDWDGAGRAASRPGLRDSAAVNLSGGLYTVWVLAGGRGQGIGVYLGDRRVGGIDPNLPDGWQRVGRARLDSGRLHVHLVSEAGPRAPEGAAPRYAATIVTADSSFSPPEGLVLDVYNSLALLTPHPGEALSGQVEFRATGAGNLTAVRFLLDGELLRHVSGPPFTFSLNTARLANGRHVLRLEGMDRAGPSGLDIEIPIVIAN